MKKRVVLPAALAVLALLTGALCAGVFAVATDAQLYGAYSREAVAAQIGTDDADAVTQAIGLTQEEQQRAATQIAEYMRSGSPDEPLYPVIAQGETIFGEREAMHMQDVRRLMRLADTLAKALIPLAAGLAVVCAWVGAGRQKDALLGAGAALLLAAAIAGALLLALGSAGFERAFAGMHRVLFANDLWLLNPQTDVLIRMMPLPLFARAAQDALGRAAGMAAVGGVMLAAAYFLVEGMVRRHLTERKEQ